MRRKSGVTAALLVGLMMLLVGAAAALASTTIGPEPANPNPSGANALNSPSGRLLFNDAAPAGTVLATPSEGTITSWRLYTGEVGSEATAQLYALTPAGGANYTVVGVGPKEPLTPVVPSGSSENNVLNTFSADLKVPAGTLLGVRVEYPSGSTVQPVLYIGASGWSSGCLGDCAPVPPVGGTATAVSYAQEEAMNATFEPAASGTGTTTPTCVGACAAPITTPITTPAPSAPAKSTPKCKKGKKRVKGKCVKKKSKKHHHKKKAHKK